jgi:hypothetical protein
MTHGVIEAVADNKLVPHRRPHHTSDRVRGGFSAFCDGVHESYFGLVVEPIDVLLY